MTSAFDTAFQRRFRDKLAAELRDRETTLLDGSIRNYEDYKHLTGIRKGLTKAIEIAVEVERELTSPDGLKRNTPA